MKSSAAARRETRDDVTDAPAESETRIKAADALPSEEPVTERRAKTIRKPRGFARLDPDTVRAIASRGGINAHKTGKAHEYTSKEASAAGRIGGRVAAERRRAASGDRKDG